MTPREWEGYVWTLERGLDGLASTIYYRRTFYYKTAINWVMFVVLSVWDTETSPSHPVSSC